MFSPPATSSSDDAAVVMTVNTGSSSVRLAIHRVTPEGGGLSVTPIAHRHSVRGDGIDPQQEITALLAQSAWTPTLTIHRVVHGGARLCAPTVIGQDVVETLETLAPLAPLHMPVSLSWIQAVSDRLGPAAKQVAVFDTAFFAGLPAVARTYALPLALSRKHALYRYGFHGLAHQAMLRQWCRINQCDPVQSGRVITLQLGSGCSATAIADGRPLDTSMGFSPSEGLVMSTRAGDLDPGLLSHLLRVENLSIDALDRLMNRQSGLLGVSGVSADMQEILASDSADARLAVDLFCYRVRKYIGAYTAVLGGLDGILFGGGIGENALAVRERILSGLQFLGVGRPGKVQVHVVAVDEAHEMIEQARDLL